MASGCDVCQAIHRWYDAKTGRWISEDPIGFEAGDANLYRYVGNEVTGAVDPSELEEGNPYQKGDPKYYDWQEKHGRKLTAFDGNAQTKQLAGEVLKAGEQTASLCADMIPVVSYVKNTHEIVVGVDPVTKDRLPSWRRVLQATPIVGVGVAYWFGKTADNVGHLTKAARFLENGKLFGESLKRASPGGHVFDRHAHEWFGVVKPGWHASTSQTDEWIGLIETVGRCGTTFRSSLKGRDTIARMAKVDGKFFVVHEYADTGVLASAFVPDADEIEKYRNSIRKLK